MTEQKITIVEYIDGEVGAFINMNPDILAHWTDEDNDQIESAYCLRVSDLAHVLQHVLRGTLVLRKSLRSE